MVHTRGLILPAALLALEVIPLAFAHDHDSHDSEAQAMGAPKTLHLSLPLSSTSMNSFNAAPQSYFTWPDFEGPMLAHIVLMTVAWVFVLPIGERFSYIP